MNNLCYVYLHINPITYEPFYIGKGGGLTKRKESRAFSIQNRNKHWTNIVNKYGFDVIFLENNLEEIEAFELEKYWIKRIGRKDKGLGTLVNYTDGGEGTSGRINSIETNKKIGMANKGKIRSDKVKQNLIIRQTGSKHSDETKKKMSKSRIDINNKLTNEDKIIISLKLTIHHKIIQLDLNDVIIKTWDSHHDAAKELNSFPGNIIRVCDGIRKTLKGFKWIYLA